MGLRVYPAYLDDSLQVSLIPSIYILFYPLTTRSSLPNAKLMRHRAQKDSLDTGFCIESGQVKTGDGPEDTYVKMLQEIMRVTAAVAYGIAAEYPTVQKLVEGLKKNGPLALEECRKSANKDGAFTDRRVGQAISRRVYRVFTEKDEASLDV